MMYNKERRHRYYLAHREQNHENTRRWRMTHREQENKTAREWRAVHPEQNREAVRKWHEKHPEYGRLWGKTHREQLKGYISKWQKANPEKWTVMVAKYNARRKRDLPTNHVIGLPMKDFVLHHMTPQIAIWIPVGLHRSIYHRMKNPESMKMINWRAMEWIVNPNDQLLVKEIVQF